MRFGLHFSIMSVILVFSLFLLLHVPKSCIAGKNYDFFMLVQQWPKGYCEYQKVAGNRPCPKTIPNKFTIHGLWPQTAADPQPNTCNASNPLTQTDIKPLEKLLTSNWPNLNGPDLNFWTYEWLKHGTCAEEDFSKQAYFQLALHAYNQNDLLSVLKKANVVPDKKQLYNVTSVVAAIRGHTDHDPHLECYVDPLLNVSALYEIGVCLSQNGSSYMSCHNSQGSCHGQALLFPKK